MNMTPRPPLAKTAKVEINWAGPSGAAATNIMYVLGNVDISDPTTLTAIAELFATAIQTGTEWLQQISTLWTLETVRAVDNSGLTEGIGLATPGLPGESGGGVLPPQCALCISWPISAHYRGGHPRTYVAGIPSGYLATPGGKDFTPTVQGVWEDIGTSLLAAVNSSIVAAGTSLVLGTVSYFADKLLRSVPLFRSFEGAVVGARLDSQRRRSGKEPALI